jgi:next to BRCA1 gene 1 protein
LYDIIQLPYPAPAEHLGVSCDGPLCTNKSTGTWIQGVRYKCAVCHDTDFCAACEAVPLSTHNRTHPLIKFRSPVAHVWVSTTDELATDPTPLGDRLPKTSSKATETTKPVNATTQVQTVAEFKPQERAEEAAKIESQRASPAPPFDGVFVSDTITDGSKMPASQVFCQTWTLRNPGPIPWPKGCCLRFVGGDRMLNMDAENPASTDDLDRAVSSNVIDDEVEIGATVQFSVVLKAPVRPGKAISYWRIKTPEGLAFGHKLWCEIDVTPAVPSEPPSPSGTVPETLEVERLTGLVAEKSEEITRLTQAMTDLQHALAGAQADKAAALGDVHHNMQTQRAELLAKLEEVKAESDRIRASQMIFPKLDKESPEASVYETARQDPTEPVAENAEHVEHAEPAAEPESHIDEDFIEDIESLDIEDETTDDGFLTDEEYEILDSEFEDVLSETK